MGCWDHAQDHTHLGEVTDTGLVLNVRSRMHADSHLVSVSKFPVTLIKARLHRDPCILNFYGSKAGNLDLDSVATTPHAQSYVA